MPFLHIYLIVFNKSFIFEDVVNHGIWPTTSS